MELVDALGAESSVVSVVGAGGKKTTLYALAARLDRAVVTSTVRIPLFDRNVEHLAVTTAPAEVVTETEPSSFPLGVVPEQDRSDRYRGYDPETIDRLGTVHDGPILVKADGARFREFKAPGANEPRIPDSSDVVVPIVSAHVVGRPLTERWVHRPEQVERIADIEVGDEITVRTVADVLTSEEGGLKGVPENASVIPLITKVDDEQHRTVAEEIATEIHERTSVPRVVFARFDVVGAL